MAAITCLRLTNSMSDLPSIDSLLKQSPSSSGAPDDDAVASAQASPINISSPEVTDAFKKKMASVAVKEKETEAARYASSIGFPHIDLEKFPVSTEALKQVDSDRAKKLGAVCFFVNQSQVRVGAKDPNKEGVAELLAELEEKNYASGALYVISEHSFNRILDLYRTLPKITPIKKTVEIAEQDLAAVQASVTNFQSLEDQVQRASTTDIVTFLLGAGLKLEASDIHVEPEADAATVRFRLDGMLHDAATITSSAYKKLVSRIKLLSSVKLNITNKPQDGRFTIQTPQGEVDVRVSVLPTVYGEGIVMRLLVQHREGISLDTLGLRPEALAVLKQEITRPNGMIITTGPTGSGKSTTLYAIMQILNKPGVKIVTLEDPVEYKLEGINQSQIDHSRDYTFAKGLKSILRQDPDIAMVGEIRDLETADTAIQGALTGHLLLSTLHTNSAAGAIPRFLAMGVKPFLLAPALNAVMGQRLVRKLCDACKTQRNITQEERTRIASMIADLPEQFVEITKQDQVHEATGCDTCSGLGYKGRIGIYEIFVMNQRIEEQITSGKFSEHDIALAAKEQRQLTMEQDGLIKVFEGITSLEEVFRVTQV